MEKVTEELEEKMSYVFDQLSINHKDRSALVAFAAPLKFNSDITRFHYDHSIRVALIGLSIASFMHMDKKPLLFSGYLHDIGKADIDPKVLGKSKDWTEEDTKKIKPHVVNSYNLVKDRFKLTAEIILRHHKFQANGYPEKTTKLDGYSLSTQVMVYFFGRILALADVYEALHRSDDKYGGPLNGDQVKEKMLAYNKDQLVLIQELYEAGIFTTSMENFLTDPVGEWLIKSCS